MLDAAKYFSIPVRKGVDFFELPYKDGTIIPEIIFIMHERDYNSERKNIAGSSIVN